MIDDGSTDGSIEICKKWINKDERFILIRKKNEGPSSARNLGLNRAKGDFIAFIDSDDVIHPHYLKTLVDIIIKKEYLIVVCDFLRFKKNYPLVSSHVRNFYHYIPSEAIKIMLYQNGRINSAPWGKLFRKDLIKDIWFKNGIIYEDLEWLSRVMYKMPKSKRIGICDAKLYFYRIREGSLINTFSNKRLDVLDVSKEIECNALNIGDYGIIRAARDRVLSANFEIYLALYDLKYKNRELYNSSVYNYDETIKGCWNQIKKLRLKSLLNFHVRNKNKLGILLSYFGPRIFGYIGSKMSHLK